MERLDKIIANRGAASRREVKDLVRQGRVLVNGVPASAPDMKVAAETAVITVDGVTLSAERYLYLLLHKPAGVLTATEDKRQPTVLDLIPETYRRRDLAPVGRLDKDTEGLLLLTNDGDLVNGLTHPRHEVEKHYEVRVRGNMDNIPRLSEPMDIDGYMTKPAEVSLITRKKEYSVVAITLFEGRNRQIRKMCEKLSLHVLSLRRVSIGEVKLGDLRPGKWRYLTKSQVQMLKREAKSDV